MYRMVDCGTWDDPWFAALAPDEKLLFLYLVTNRRSTSCGAFEITLRAMAFETGIAEARIESIITGWAPRVWWWPEHQIVWIRNFYKHQKPNEKFAINARRIVADLPADVQHEIGMVYPDLIASRDTFDIHHPYPIHDLGIKEEELVVVTGVEPEEGLGTEPGEPEGTPVPAADAAPPSQPKAVRSVPKSEKRQATKIPIDWQPSSELWEWATGKDWPADFIQYEAEQFVDYWRGAGGTKADWDATFRTWLRNAAPGGKFAAKATNGAANGRASPEPEPVMSDDGGLSAWREMGQRRTAT